MLRGGFEFAWTPGTAFEYSNLGYGILGRVLTNVSGLEYRDLVRERLLEPLGMGATTYDADDVSGERLVQGHVHRDDAFIDEPFDGYGALASMGGVFTSIHDLATWVTGFADAFPPRDDPQGRIRSAGEPTRDAAGAARVRPRDHVEDAAGRPTLEAGGYGFGLFVKTGTRSGTRCRAQWWLPGVRIAHALAPGIRDRRDRTRQPHVCPDDAAVRRSARRPRRCGSRTDPPGRAVGRDRGRTCRRRAAPHTWDDELAAHLFAFNVDMDEPLERRRAELERIRDRFGPFTRDDATPTESDAPVHLIWWMRGARGGRVRLEIQLTPERPPRVQSLDVREVAEPSAALRSIADRVAALITDGASAWPHDLVPTGTSATDRAIADRSLRAAGARFAPVTVGEPTHGDGTRTATFPLTGGDRGDAILTIALDPAGTVTELNCAPERLGLPPITPPGSDLEASASVAGSWVRSS